MVKELSEIVRVAGFDLDGTKKIGHQLSNVRGVGINFSNMVCKLMHLSKSKKASDLTEEEIKRIEEIITKPIEFGAPEFMLNRRRDIETGTDMHLISNELKFTSDNDIKIMRKIKSYKGVRHSARLPVRGQQTKSNFRKNKGKVTGVKRKK